MVVFKVILNDSLQPLFARWLWRANLYYNFKPITLVAFTYEVHVHEVHTAYPYPTPGNIQMHDNKNSTYIPDPSEFRLNHYRHTKEDMVFDDSMITTGIAEYFQDWFMNTKNRLG